MYNTIQHNTLTQYLYNTIQYNTIHAQYNIIIQHNNTIHVQYNTIIQYSTTIQYNNTTQHNTIIQYNNTIHEYNAIQYNNTLLSILKTQKPICAHVKDPTSICWKRVGLTAGGIMETQKHCTQEQKCWVAPDYGCSLSPCKAAQISCALHWGKKVI